MDDDRRMTDVLHALAAVARLMAARYGGDADALGTYADRFSASGDQDADNFRRVATATGRLRDAWVALADAADRAGAEG